MKTASLALVSFIGLVVLSLVLGLVVQYHLDFLQAPCCLLLAACLLGLVVSFVQSVD